MRTHELLDQLQGSELESLSFSSPWAARLFGMTLAAAQKKLFSLQEFQQVLIESIQHHEQDACIASDEQYYTCWLEALQSLLERQNLLEPERLGALEAQIMEVAQERHDHQRTGHGHGHHHHSEPERLA
ncbi:MAG: nitrile hydratase accessory protein [Pseudoalteromonas distincta]